MAVKQPLLVIIGATASGKSEVAMEIARRAGGEILSVDSSFDVAVVINFADESAMADYEQNPIHKKAVSDVLRPLTAKIIIYDIAPLEAATTR